MSKFIYVHDTTIHYIHILHTIIDISRRKKIKKNKKKKRVAVRVARGCLKNKNIFLLFSLFDSHRISIHTLNARWSLFALFGSTLKEFWKKTNKKENITANDEFHGILKSQKLCTIYGWTCQKILRWSGSFWCKRNYRVRGHFYMVEETLW